MLYIGAAGVFFSLTASFDESSSLKYLRLRLGNLFPRIFNFLDGKSDEISAWFKFERAVSKSSEKLILYYWLNYRFLKIISKGTSKLVLHYWSLIIFSVNIKKYRKLYSILCTKRAEDSTLVDCPMFLRNCPSNDILRRERSFGPVTLQASRWFVNPKIWHNFYTVIFCKMDDAKLWRHLDRSSYIYIINTGKLLTVNERKYYNIVVAVFECVAFIKNWKNDPFVLYVFYWKGS